MFSKSLNKFYFLPQIGDFLNNIILSFNLHIFPWLHTLPSFLPSICQKHSHLKQQADVNYQRQVLMDFNFALLEFMQI